MVSLSGAMTAMVTPFREGRVDEARLRENVEFQIKSGIDGLVPVGTTGESPTLDFPEHERVIELAVEVSRGRVPVIAGTGALSTRETVELSVHAERAGAAAVMIVPPFYDALSWRELLAHYTAVADAIDIPIMYYNLPAATGVRLTAAQFRELQERAGVTCLKDTGGDAVAATELTRPTARRC